MCIRDREIDREDDGTLLKKYYDYGTYTQTGAVDDRHSGLRGKLTLTKYLACLLYTSRCV